MGLKEIMGGEEDVRRSRRVASRLRLLQQTKSVAAAPYYQSASYLRPPRGRGMPPCSLVSARVTVAFSPETTSSSSSFSTAVTIVFISHRLGQRLTAEGQGVGGGAHPRPH